MVGAGIAGLRAAVGLAAHARVLVVAKEQLGESNTHYAQGGIAVAMEGPDDVLEHMQDTLAAGDGLVDPASVAVLVREGPHRVEELLRWGAAFDRGTAGELLRTREGAHSRHRVLHANGDATGAEIARSLRTYAQTHPAITFMEWTACAGLLRDEHGRVAGVALVDREGAVTQALGRAVLLASGGAGQAYSNTTNPLVATGDGIALGWRAGAAVADMEFYQFHPTAFSQAGAPRFLLSEALRGEGAYLRNAAGERFMERYHLLGELAPRDVVARAITREGLPQEPGGAPREVFLDLRHTESERPGLRLAARFPGISAFLAKYGFALNRDLIPVRPAAHYLMGGVLTDMHGRTSIPGLYAAGEVACTGVHGANRLASNSLLEGLVFGARAGEAMLAETLPTAALPLAQAMAAMPDGGDETRSQLQAEMWRNAGLLRDRDGLEHAAARIAGWQAHRHVEDAPDRKAIELQNLLNVSALIVKSALAREESRGAHARTDFEARNDEQFARHSCIAGEGAVTFSHGVEVPAV